MTNELTVLKTDGITSVKVSELSEQDLRKINEIANKLDVMSQSEVTDYGTSVLKDISQLSTSVLSRESASDINDKVNDILKNTISTMRKSSLITKKARKGLFGIIDRWRTNAQEKLFEVQFATKDVNQALNMMEGKLTVYIDDLERDAKILEDLKLQNREHYNELSLYIAAGELKLHEFKNEVLPKVKEEAEKSCDMMEMQNYNEMLGQLGQLERRLHNLLKTRQMVLQQAPQIVALQKADYDQIQQLQEHVMLSVPLWRKQLTLTSMLTMQAEISNVNKAAADFTNQLMVENAKLLNTTVTQIAEQNERGIIDNESFSVVTSEIEGMISNVMQAQIEGRRKRKEAEALFEDHERRLKNAVLTASNHMLETSQDVSNIKRLN